MNGDSELKFRLPHIGLGLEVFTKVYYIDGYWEEPQPFFIRKFLEDRLWIKRRLMLSRDLPTYTASIEFPDQNFFYGIPSAYARRATTHGWLDLPNQITCVSAMDHKSGILWAARKPFRHHHLMQFMWEYGVSALDRQSANQGFLNGVGQHLGREEALQIALNTRQMKEYMGDKPIHSHERELFSEDLW